MLKRLAFFIVCIGHVFGNLVYVANSAGTTVSVIDTSTNTVKATITVGPSPVGVATSFDGQFAYVANNGSTTVSVINTGNNTVTSTITVGGNPRGLAVTPDGTQVYVAVSGGNVSVINTTTHAVSTVPVDTSPQQIAITPSGQFAYVTNLLGNDVSVINTMSNTVVATLSAGSFGFSQPQGIAITPNGKFAYVTNESGGNVTVIDISNNNAFVTSITVGATPFGIAITPDGAFVYAVNSGDGTISVINTAMNSVVNTISSPNFVTSFDIAITPNGNFAYVTNGGASDVSVINIKTNSVVGAPIPVGATPFGVAISRGPTAPANLTGKQVKNNFGTETERFNQLKWQAGMVTVPVVGYFVYRDGVKIATLSASTFKYEDHNRKKGVTTVYSVAGFDSNGNEGTSSTVIIE